MRVRIPLWKSLVFAIGVSFVYVPAAECFQASIAEPQEKKPSRRVGSIPPPFPTEMKLSAADRDKVVVADVQAAITKAWCYVGEPASKKPDATAEKVVLGRSNAPYMWRSLEGRPVWKVRITNLVLRSQDNDPRAIESVPTGTTPPVGGMVTGRDVEVTIDATLGRLIELRVLPRSGNAATYREPDGETATRGMFNIGLETWKGLPENPPKTSFLGALESIRNQGWQTDDAKEIVAHYVEWYWMRRDEREAWSIHTRGIDPVQRNRDGQVPVEARNHLRHIVDGKTGEWVTAGTTPQPSEKPAEPNMKPDQPAAPKK